MCLILQTSGVSATLLPVAQKATTVTAHRMGVDIPTGLGYEKHCRLQEATGQICLFLTESSWFDKNKSFYCHLLAKGYQEPRNVHCWPVNGSQSWERQNLQEHSTPENQTGQAGEIHRETGPHLSAACQTQQNTFKTMLFLNTKPSRKVDGSLWTGSLTLMLYCMRQTALTWIWPVWAHLTFQPEA